MFVGVPGTPPVTNDEITGDPEGTTPTDGVMNDITAPGKIAEGDSVGENGETPTDMLVGISEVPVPEPICVDDEKPLVVV